MSYAYNRERLKRLHPHVDLADILEKAAGLRVDYPQVPTGRVQAERTRLQIALLLAQNPLNIAYQLLRLESQSTARSSP